MLLTSCPCDQLSHRAFLMLHYLPQGKGHSHVANWVVKQSIQTCTYQPNQKYIAALLTGWSNNPFNHRVCHHTRVPMEKAATACALAPVKTAAPATTSPASASARRACRERTVRTAAPLATSARPATSSASSSVPPATATASSASASAGRGGSVPPATCRVRCSPGGPTACSSVTVSPRTPRAVTQRWGNLGCSYVFFFFFFSEAQVWAAPMFFLCVFFSLFLFSFSQSPNLGCSHIVIFSFFFLFLKNPGLGCSHVFSFSQKSISGLLPCFFVLFSFFFFSKAQVWASPMFICSLCFFLFSQKPRYIVDFSLYNLLLSFSAYEHVYPHHACT